MNFGGIKKAAAISLTALLLNSFSYARPTAQSTPMPILKCSDETQVELKEKYKHFTTAVLCAAFAGVLGNGAYRYSQSDEQDKIGMTFACGLGSASFLYMGFDQTKKGITGSEEFGYKRARNKRIRKHNKEAREFNRELAELKKIEREHKVKIGKRKQSYTKADNLLNILSNLQKRYVSDNSKQKANSITSNINSLKRDGTKMSKSELSSKLNKKEKEISKLKRICNIEDKNARPKKRMLDVTVAKYKNHDCFAPYEKNSVISELNNAFNNGVSFTNYSAFNELNREKLNKLTSMSQQKQKRILQVKRLEDYIKTKQNKLSFVYTRNYEDKITSLKSRAECEDVGSSLRSIREGISGAIRRSVFDEYLQTFKEEKSKELIKGKTDAYMRREFYNSQIHDFQDGTFAIYVSALERNQFNESTGFQHYLVLIKYDETNEVCITRDIKKSKTRRKTVADVFIEEAAREWNKAAPVVKPLLELLK